jgi:hypothetical protein
VGANASEPNLGTAPKVEPIGEWHFDKDGVPVAGPKPQPAAPLRNPEPSKTSTARERIEAAQPANGELLVDSRFASADLETPETDSRHAARGVIPKLCIRPTKRRFASIARGAVNGDPHMDGSANLCRETRDEARQLADSRHDPTCSLRGDKGAHPTLADDAKDDVSR